MVLRQIFQLVIVLIFFIFFKDTESITYSIIGGIGKNNSTFGCGHAVVLRCHARQGAYSVLWQINYTVLPGTDLAAECYDFQCDTYKNFSSRYSFSYDKNTGISDLDIHPVVLQDDNMEFKCADYSDPLVFKASVKLFPNNETTTMVVDNSTGSQQIIVTTNCTIISGTVSFFWYKINKGDVEIRTYLNETIPVTSDEICKSSLHCPGKSFYSVYALDHSGSSKAYEEYYIQCVVNVTDSDSPGPVIKTSKEIFISQDITTVTTIISPSQTTTSSVTKSSTSEMKTTTTTTNANASLPTSLPTTTTSNANANTSFPTSLQTTSAEPRTRDQDKLKLIYIFSPLGSVIVIVIVIYVICIYFRQQKTLKAKETNTVI